MSISPLYIPLFSIEEVILNKDTGLPLSGGVVKFYRDSQRASPKTVFMISGTSPNYTFESVGNELTLGISGTFVDADGDPFVPYAYPYDAAGDIDLYYVTVESSGAVAQFVREAVPYTGSGAIPPSQRSNTENELSNPQFVEVLFPSSGTTTISVTGSNTVTPIAPDWVLITSGTGTVAVERLQPTSASVPTNPPYALRINADAALGASISLRQRLTNSPSVLRGGFVSATLTAAVISGGATSLSLAYVPSTGTATTIISNTAIATDGAYHTISDNDEVPQQGNTAASTGYVDIIITIPTARNIAITSIQVVGVPDSIDIPFDEQTAGRQKDHLFHYYEDSILRQPKADLLTGWNFGLNPWQFRVRTASNVADNTYTADQTIIVQQKYVESATANNISVARGTAAENYAFVVRAVTATNKFAIIQYIDPSIIRPYWGENLSSLVSAYISSPTHSTSCRFKMRLIHKAGLPNVISQTDPVASWAAGGEPVLAAGWTGIHALNDPIYTFGDGSVPFSFDQFTLPASAGDNMTLGIMLYTLDDLTQTATADRILFNRISLVQNDFAIDVAPESYNEAFQKCQFYYEKSYESENLAGTVTATGQRFAPIQVVKGVPDDVSFQAFGVTYNTVKRVVPSITFYSPNSATADRVRIGIRNSGANSFVDSATSNWSASGESTKGMVMLGNNNASATTLATNLANQGCIFYHFEADSRLGV